MKTGNKEEQNKKYIGDIFLAVLMYSIVFTILTEIFFSRIKIENSIMLIITSILSFVPVGAYLVRKRCTEMLFAQNGKCTIAVFIYMFMLVVGLNLIVTQIQMPLEKLFSLFGITAGVLQPVGETTGVLYLIYVCIMGPVFEELIYRGFLMNGLKKYGGVRAIIISAICFGIMHHDFYQGLAAFVGGLVYGYAAQRYSLGVSVALHVANNSFAEMLPYLKKSGTAGSLIIVLIVLGAAVAVLSGAFRYIGKIVKSGNNKLCSNEKNTESDISWIEIFRNWAFWSAVIFDVVLLVFQSFHRV